MNKPKVFISYSRADEEPWKNRLQKHLEVLDKRGSLSFWEDRQIAPGTEWYEEIKAALESAEAAILLISVDFLRSKFIRENEVPAILQRRMQEGMKVFPLILRSCPWQGEEWLSRLQARPTDGKPLAQFDKDDDVDLALTRFATEIESLLNRQPEPVISLPEPAPELECPYLGLEAFTEDKQHLFFGRDKFIKAIEQKLNKHPFVAVVGPSGSGKSSVVQAGVFPRFREWHKVVFRPDEDPFLDLAAELFNKWPTPPVSYTARDKAIRELAQQIRDSKSIEEAIKETLAKLPSDGSSNRLLLVADQFEQLFTLTRIEDRHSFVAALLAAQHLPQLKVVITLRSDFLGHAQNLPFPFSQLLDYCTANHRRLEPDDWKAVILQPAKTVGLQVDPALVSLILEEIEAQHDSLPLLEYALKELWRQQENGCIGLAHYEAIGKLGGAINQRADAVLAELPAEQQPLALRALTRLVRVSGGEEEGADTRLRLPLTDELREVLKAFIDAHLLVTNRNDRTGEQTIEVAHEALIRQWEKLREALDNDREFLVWRRRLNLRRIMWEQKERADNWLLSGGEYDDAQKWLTARRSELEPVEIEFISWADRPDFQIAQIFAKAPELFVFSGVLILQNWFSTLVFTGEQEKALSLARDLEIVGDRTSALGSISMALLKAGFEVEAREAAMETFAAARTIERDDERATALESTSHLLMKTGMSREALTAACEIEDEISYADALSSIAGELVKEGLVAETLSAAYAIDDAPDRVTALCTVAEAFVKAGLKMEAREVAIESFGVAQKIKTRDYRDVFAMGAVAETLEKADLKKEARKAARKALANTNKITPASDRIMAFQFLAETLWKTGIKTEALKAARDALALANQIEDAGERAKELSSIAEAWANKGMQMEARTAATNALAAIPEIESRFDRAKALKGMAKALVKTEMRTELLDTAYELEEEEEDGNFVLAYVLNAIAQTLGEEGITAEALAIAHEIENSHYREAALCAIVKPLVKAGLVTETLAAASEIEAMDNRAAALMSVAEFWLEHGQSIEAVDLLQEIQTTVSKIYNTLHRSMADQRLTRIFAQLHRYREAREYADQCHRNDQLAAYTAIVREYHLERNPSLAPLFAEEADETEDDWDEL